MKLFFNFLSYLSTIYVSITCLLSLNLFVYLLSICIYLSISIYMYACIYYYMTYLRVVVNTESTSR